MFKLTESRYTLLIRVVVSVQFNRGCSALEVIASDSSVKAVIL